MTWDRGVIAVVWILESVGCANVVMAYATGSVNFPVRLIFVVWMQVKRRADVRNFVKLHRTSAQILGRRVVFSMCSRNSQTCVYIPCQCSCTLLSAPPLMRAWNLLHITIKTQTQKVHSTLRHKKYILR